MNRILSHYIITDIVNIICLYVGRYRLQHVKSIQLACDVEHFFERKENVYFNDGLTMYEIIGNEIKSYKCPLIPYNVLDKDIVLTRKPLEEFKIFNLKTSQVIQNISNVHNMCHITSNNKYMILTENSRDYSKQYIKIYDIKKMTCLHNNNIDNNIIVEGKIIGNIIYLIDINKPMIYKYSMTGKHLGKVKLNELDRLKIKILSTEIIVVCKNKITYYDLDGRLHRTEIIGANEEIKKFTATPNYIYTVGASRMLNIYKRIS